MRFNRIQWIAAALLLLTSPAGAADWKALGAANGHGETLSLAVDADHSYVFECAPDAVLVSETGVTDLIDIRGGGAKVGDAPGSTMPEGAALMALYGGKGDPNFLPASYAANPKKGWDLTIKVPKRDKQLDALVKADMMSLFTTGFTAAVTLSVPERKMFADFLARCRA
jgi:hypothetical protein